MTLKNNWKIFTIAIILFIITLTFILPYYLFITQTLKVSILKTLLFIDKPKTYNNQINILALGITKKNCEFNCPDGYNLSDSIIVFNYNFSNNKITSISIPRDIWSNTLRDKINSAYAYGEEKQKGGGLKLAKAEIGNIIGQPIHYAFIIDFEKFKNIIDLLDGIDVNVEHSFTDSQYPIEGKKDDLCDGDPKFACRYETISFKKGLQRIDGLTTLKFVRSRYATNEEGGDFAREKRQQAVINAIRSKLIKQIKTGNLNTIKKLYQIVDKAIERDIANQQISTIAINILLHGKLKQQSLVLNQNFFEIPNYDLYDGKYVLIPIADNYQPIYDYILCNTNSPLLCK